jgi:hypothetical protein
VQAEHLEEHGVGGELLGHGFLAHGVAAVLYDHGLAIVDLDVGQGFGERLGGRPSLALVVVAHGPAPGSWSAPIADSAPPVTFGDPC